MLQFQDLEVYDLWIIKIVVWKLPTFAQVCWQLTEILPEMTQIISNDTPSSEAQQWGFFSTKILSRKCSKDVTGGKSLSYKNLAHLFPLGKNPTENLTFWNPKKITPTERKIIWTKASSMTLGFQMFIFPRVFSAIWVVLPANEHEFHVPWYWQDGSEIRQTHQLRLLAYPTIYILYIYKYIYIYWALYIPSGAFFLPSTVCNKSSISKLTQLGNASPPSGFFCRTDCKHKERLFNW